MPPVERPAPRPRLREQLGRVVHDARLRLSLTTVDLSAITGISRQMIGEIERGIANPTARTIERLLDCLGVDLDVIIRDQAVILGAWRRQRDAAHAILSGFIQRRLEAMGYLVAREVRIDSGRYHGWIDLLAFDPTTRTLFLIEIKTIIDDLGGIERTMDWYAREAIGVAEGLGWHPLCVVPWLLVLATDDVDAQLRANRAAIDAAFPMRALAMWGVLTDPSSVTPAGPVPVAVRGVALVDPRSRRRVWLQRSRLDGRRSSAPYRNYADFMTWSEGA